jgi:uncharacterized membrane protein YeaQ/YmgE (transglycosylase-associated protein family)
MDLVVTILIGLAIGLVGELMLPGHTGCEFILAMLLGIAGALLARHVGLKEGWFGTTEPRSFLASGMGSVVFLTVYALFFRKPNSRHR